MINSSLDLGGSDGRLFEKNASCLAGQRVATPRLRGHLEAPERAPSESSHRRDPTAGTREFLGLSLWLSYQG